VTSRGQPAAPARDDGLTGLAAESAKSAEAAEGDHNCSDDDRECDYSKRDDDCQLDKDDCEPQNECCGTKPSADCGNGDTYRSPGEALAKIDFSRW
jgi:ATP-binding cassette subfamily B protein RaxB